MADKCFYCGWERLDPPGEQMFRIDTGTTMISLHDFPALCRKTNERLTAMFCSFECLVKYVLRSGNSLPNCTQLPPACLCPSPSNHEPDCAYKIWKEKQRS
jgi:hypothetical protein